MSDWTDGYLTDIGYTYGYYLELNPQHARLALLNKGLAVPEFSTACELGFGQGISVNIHAAGALGQWYATDFNPAGQCQVLPAIRAVSWPAAVLTTPWLGRSISPSGASCARSF